MLKHVNIVRENGKNDQSFQEFLQKMMRVAYSGHPSARPIGPITDEEFDALILEYHSFGHDPVDWSEDPDTDPKNVANRRA